MSADIAEKSDETLMCLLAACNNVELLVRKAEKAEKSDDALKLSQAACNSANAIHMVLVIRKEALTT